MLKTLLTPKCVLTTFTILFSLLVATENATGDAWKMYVGDYTDCQELQLGWTGYISVGTRWIDYDGDGEPERSQLAVVKYDNSFAKEWIHYVRIGFTDWAGGTSVCLTSDGGYIVTGYRSPSQPPDGDMDLFLAKLDSSGNLQWKKTFGGMENDRGNSVMSMGDGFIIAGYTESYGAGGKDMWLLCTDSEGEEVWNTTFGLSGDDSAEKLLNTDGGPVFVGHTYVEGDDSFEALIGKLDESGNIEWTNSFGGSGRQEAYGGHLANDGGYIITGVSYIPVNVKSVLLAKTDDNGIVEWISEILPEPGNAEEAVGYDVIPLDSGYIVGGTAELYYNTRYLMRITPWGIKICERVFGDWDDQYGCDLNSILEPLSGSGILMVGGGTPEFTPRAYVGFYGP